MKIGLVSRWSAIGCLVVLALQLTVFVVPLAGQTPKRAPSEERVARLIQRLGSSSYTERTRANNALIKLGAAGRKQLEQATNSSDPETKLRAYALLRKLNIDRLWTASGVQLKTDSVDASSAVREIARQTANRLSVGDQYRTFKDKKIKLRHPSGTFWPVLDDICRQTGNHVRPHYNPRQASLVVVAGQQGKYPVAYGGPLRTSITSARKVFIEEFDYEDLSSDITHTFQLNLRLMWEDRFRLLAYRAQPEIDTVVTDKGVQLAATQPTDTSWNVAGRGARQLTASLRITPPPERAARLDRLGLKWDLIAVGDFATLETKNLASGQVVRQDDVELTIENFERASKLRYTATVIVSRDLIIPDPVDVLYHENQIQLLDQEGAPLHLENQINTQVSSGAKFRITFAATSASQVPTRLRLTYPRLRSRRKMSIQFRDVPLPQGTIR